MGRDPIAEKGLLLKEFTEFWEIVKTRTARQTKGDETESAKFVLT